MANPLDPVAQMVRNRDLESAATALARLVRKKGVSGVDWRAAAGIANTLGDQDLALAATERWRDDSPGDPLRQIAVVNALGVVARHRDAAKLARKLQDDPRAGAEGFYLEGICQARFGRRDEALALFRRALAQAPQHAMAWEQIALLQGYENLESDVAAMQALAQQLNNPSLQVPICYAIGRALDAMGDYEGAFAAISSGAALREKLSPFNLQPQLDYYQRLAQTFTPGLLSQLQNDAGGEGAVFIIGAPRSGSTLVEQILATAAGVTPTGEHTLIRLASLPLGSMEPPDMAAAAGFERRDWLQMAQRYLKGVRQRFRPAGAFTDKSSLNHNFAGLIRILYPRAKFIWLRRDPRDVAWSCFRSRISANQWAQKLEDCLRFLAAHESLCAHWQSVFGDDLLQVSYEDLVQNSEATTAALFAHVGLERPPGWGDFYQSKNPVATASLAQVREPLSQAALGKWRRYEQHLAPIYERAGLAMGPE